jgi:hypothetical protein
MECYKGQNVLAYDSETKNWKGAIIKDIRENVPSTFDRHIYPILFDIEFLHNKKYSKGHLSVAIMTDIK